MLPIPVMEQIQREYLDYNNMGVSVVEISHRSKEFDKLLGETDELFRELVALPKNYKILYMHGGAQMQFSAVPMNILGLKPAKKAIYIESGNFAKVAHQEASRYGEIEILASSKETNFDRIPDFDPSDINPEASYFYITSNNTVMGTRWNKIPQTGEVPLVADATSEILSRKLDFSQFGLIFAGTQKNLGPSGLAMTIIREDLLGKAMSETPKLLNYQQCEKDHSLTNTPNTFAIYVIRLVLEWLKGKGGVEAIEKINIQKSNILYDLIDKTSFYLGHSQPEHRSTMNVTFNLANGDLLETFLKEALAEGFYALKGHRAVGGARASIYNAMPIEGVQALADFMKHFEQKNG